MAEAALLAVWLLIGAGLGAAAVALALARRVDAGPRGPASRLTSAWRLGELGTPLVLARRVTDVDVPAGSRILVAEDVAPEVATRCDVRRGDVASDLALAPDGRRALLFPRGLGPGNPALVLADAGLAGRLLADAEAAWERGTPWTERRGLADLTGDVGTPVEAEGRLAQRLPRAGGLLLRLEDGGHSAAVHAPARLAPEELEGRRVRVRGRLARDAGGYLVVEADAVEALP